MPERLKITVSPNREVRLVKGLAVNHGKRVAWDGTEAGYLGTSDSPAPISTEDADFEPPLLDISSEFQRTAQTEKPGWGGIPKQSRFGTPQKRLMLRAGAVCDREYGARQVVLTGTLPGNTNDANFALACWSGYAMNRLQQWIRRIVKNVWNFGVWEYQKRGALHFHLCVCYDSESEAEKLIGGFKDQWGKILGSIRDKSGIDIFDTGRGFSWREDSEELQADAQIVRRSCAAYFAKYATKGFNDAVDAQMETNKLCKFPPSRWVVVSRAISRAIVEQTFSFEVEGNRCTIEEKFEEWLHEFEQSSCKSFAYQHKVIAGKTKVFYFEDCEFIAITKQIKEMFRSKADEASEEVCAPTKTDMCALSGDIQKAIPKRKNKLSKHFDRCSLKRRINSKRYGRVLAAMVQCISPKQLNLVF